jgi:hypothetical protein
MSDPTEGDLFEEVLASMERDTYDPAIHLLPELAGKRWKLTPRSALIRLRKHAQEYGLEECTVINPATGRPATAFRKVGS